MDDIRVGRHVLQPNRQLLLDGKRVTIGPRALAIIGTLAARRGEIVTKDELFEAVWPDTIVEENSLQVHIASLRKALGEDAGLIETVRGVGYQLLDNPPEPLAAEPGKDEPAHEPVPQVAAGEEIAAGREAAAEPARAPAAAAPDRPQRRNLPLVLGACAIVLLGLALLVLPVFSSEQPAAADVEQTLVILPLATDGGEQQAFLGSSLSSTLSSELGQLPRIRMIAATSARAIAQDALTPNEVAERFGIDLLLEGEVRTRGEGLSATVRLVEAASARQVWTDTVEIASGNLGMLQGQLAQAIAAALKARVGAGAEPAKAIRTTDPEAYRAYLQGIYGLNFPLSEGDKRLEAYRHFSRAVELDPVFAEAWAARAYLLEASFKFFFLPERDRPADTVMEDAERALALDPDNMMAQVAATWWTFTDSGKVERAVADLEAVLARDPGNEAAANAMRFIYFQAGDPERMLEWEDRFYEVDPFNLNGASRRQTPLLYMGDYEALVDFLDECELCDLRMKHYLFGMGALATPEQIRRDLPRVEAMLRQELPGEQVERLLAVPRWLATGEEMTPAMEQRLLDSSPYEAALAAWFGAEADVVFEKIGWEDAPYFWTSIMTAGGRYSLPPAMRADPRFHARFDNPIGRNVLAYRRKRGLKEGMPIEPGEVAAEEARLAARGLVPRR
ncbi:winged helix-turn-helix domain-containing protein [Erythrobacter sp.]|uniref:winged helix-turn-helix domain-containing tetratricopeptide repeat protein n=1 Tax=Erythrobacter sp. TaxID=1042 RepID=UPI001426019E|nr:winged helix-turn-helix domain-containing protein [Erythrobacter sp.]QIQ86905.1 MAG: hypothetical protein G9473_09550 [Erythrobacter sp.]